MPNPPSSSHMLGLILIRFARDMRESVIDLYFDSIWFNLTYTQQSYIPTHTYVYTYVDARMNAWMHTSTYMYMLRYVLWKLICASGSE